MLIAGGAVAYKLTQKDTERVEEHTGKKVEDLSDEEMQAAMKDLNIESQELTEEDQAALAAQETEEAEEG